MFSTTWRSMARLTFTLGVAAVCTIVFTAPARAQTPLKIITPDQPGGGLDSLIRPMAERLGRELGRPVIVENKPGGRSQIAAQAVLQAPEIKSFYGNFGFEPGGMPTADFARLIKSDYERWGKFIKAIGYTGEP